MSRHIGWALVAAVVVVAAPAPSGAGSSSPLVVEADVVDTYSVDPSGQRLDPWIVWICAIDPGPVPSVPLTPDEAATVLTDQIAPYFEWLSDGAYRPTFTAGGTLPAGTNEPGDADCGGSASVAAASAGFAGAVVITDAVGSGAVAVSGHKDCGSPPCVAATTLPGNGRTVKLGAQHVVATSAGGAELATTAHEFGHALDWGHASAPAAYRAEQDSALKDPQAPWLDEISPGFVADFDAGLSALVSGAPGLAAARAAVGAGPVDCLSVLPPDPGFTICTLYWQLEYGDVADVMGSTPSPLSTDRNAIPQTQVFNRYAAGWIDPGDVVVHAGEVATYVLAPIDVEGIQMLVLPGTDPRRFVTLEARADSPFLRGDQLRPGARSEGLAIHLVDQRPDACGKPLCWGDTGWKTMTALGTPWASQHLLSAGARTTIGGVGVTVLDQAADGSVTVQVGTPTGPGVGTTPGTSVAEPAVVTPQFAG